MVTLQDFPVDALTVLLGALSVRAIGCLAVTARRFAGEDIWRSMCWTWPSRSFHYYLRSLGVHREVRVGRDATSAHHLGCLRDFYTRREAFQVPGLSDFASWSQRFRSYVAEFGAHYMMSYVQPLSYGLVSGQVAGRAPYRDLRRVLLGLGPEGDKALIHVAQTIVHRLEVGTDVFNALKLDAFYLRAEVDRALSAIDVFRIARRLEDPDVANDACATLVRIADVGDEGARKVVACPQVEQHFRQAFPGVRRTFTFGIMVRHHRLELKRVYARHRAQSGGVADDSSAEDGSESTVTETLYEDALYEDDLWGE